MKKLGLVFILATALFAGNTGNKVWHPYKFKGTEHFKYKILVKGDNGEKKTGSYVIDLSRAGRKYKISIKGSLGESEGSVSTQMDNLDDVTSFLFTQMIFNPWLAPLTTTLFGNILIATYSMGALSKGLVEGSHWEYKSKDGQSVEFRVKGTCEYAGRKGKMLTMRTNGEFVYQSCIDPDLPLPIFVKYYNKNDSTTTSIELVEYKD